MASSPYASTEETTNACRACRLLLGPCTDELRDVLVHHVPLSTFPYDIKQKRSNLPRLTAQQMNLILPRGSSYTGNYGDMDISLLYILLRNICGIPPHSNGWGYDPDPTDRSLSANIERIRIARNQCVHSSSPVLSNADFNIIWSTVRSAVVDIDSFLNNGNKFEREVDFLRHETMDPVRDCHYIEELRKQAEEDAETREMVQGLKRKLEENEKDNSNKIQKIVDKIEEVIPPNVKDLHERQVIKWREEDEVYSETHTFQEMLNKVKRQPYMTFVGVPGSGKSATIHHIALLLQEEGYEVVPIIDIRKIEDYSDSRHPQVFVIDDVVGVLGLQKQKLEALVDYEKIISDHSNKRTKVLMTCREAVFNECYKSFFINEESVIKMCSPENTLNDDDKKAILQKYGLDEDLLSPTLLRKTSAMFPLLCKLYSNGANFRKNIESFFTCPTACILKEFDKMQEQNRLQYATLVLCLLNGNKLSKEILKETENKVFYEMKRKTLENCEVESYTDSFKFVKALLVMEGTYTKLCGFEYTFIHDSMFEIIAHHFGSQFPNLILQFMSSSYIANYVKLQKYEMLKLENEYKQASEKDSIDGESKNEKNNACESPQKGGNEALSAENSNRMESFDLCIRLGEDLYSMLAERLYRDIENMELYDVFMNDILKHPQVCQAFLEVLEAKSYSELKSLFLSEQKDVSKVMSKGERMRKEIEEWNERSMEEDRQRALVNEKYDKLEHTYSVRVISWVVYYGHKQILQYILEQTECHKETESELFFNSFKLALLNSTREEENRTAANDPVENLRSFIDLDIDGSISEHQRLLELSCYNGDLETVKLFIRYFKRNTIYTTFPDLEFKFLLGDEALKAACGGGHLSVMKELLEAGADVNQKGEVHTPLTAACVGGHMSVVKELIEAGADINQQVYYNTPLTAACGGGHMSVVKELIEAGADVNQQSEFATPLKAACKGGHIRIVKELIEAGADINPQFEYYIPLIAACEGGHMSEVKELIEAGADINLQGRFDTPLIAACKDGHMSVVKELIEAGADINLQGYYHTPLTAACEGGHMSVVKELIEAGADINLQGDYESPLTAACKSGHMSVVKELIEAGADINQLSRYYTPLTAACHSGHVSVVKELIEAEADINLLGKYDTPLIAACESGHMSVVKELLGARADVNLQRRVINNETPLTVACKGGHFDIVKELLVAGADVNKQRDTPLTAACKGGHMSVVKELIEAGADINLQGYYHTPLTAACEGGHMSVVKELIEAGADINLQGEYDTPLTAACKSGHMSVVKELIEAGADVNLQGRGINNETPLTVACKGGHFDIVKKLLVAGADVNQEGKNFTPQTAACRDGHINVVKELMEAGANVNVHSEIDSPLTAAIKGGNNIIVKELLRTGSNVNPQDTHVTPQIEACKGGHESSVKKLLGTGADVNSHSTRETPLIAACYGGHMSIVMDLLKAGADVNLQRGDNTPLTAACDEGHLSIVRELLSAGADVNLGKNNTPLTAACEKGYMIISKKLLDAGSDINMQDKEGNTPLYKAFVNIHKTFIPVILRMFYFYGADSTIRSNKGISPFYVALIRNKIGSVKQLLRTENESQLDRLRLHLFECLVDIRHSDVMTDSKDDVVVTRRRVWRMERWGDLHQIIKKSDCKDLEHLLRVGLDVNQWIELYYDYHDWFDERLIHEDDVRPLLFTLIDEYGFDDRLVDEVRFLLEAGVDVNVRVRYSECDSVLDSEYNSVLDREGVSVLERTRRLVSKFRKNALLRDKVFNYTRVIKEVKKHVRRYSM